MLNWYALQVQSRLGKIASTTLRAKGYEELLPLCHTQRHSGARVKDVEHPLFPGYMFCRFDSSGRILPILTTPGVMRIVSVGKTPIPVTDEEIESIRMVLQSGLAAEPGPFPCTGCKVVIERGPLTGIEGIVTEAAGAQQLVVSVTLLQRSVSVEIDRRWARCLSATSGCPGLQVG